MGAAATTLIRSVEVAGQQRLDAASIRQHVGLGPGETCETGRLDAAMKRAFSTGYYADVRLECRESRLSIIVEENPVVGRVAFKGRSALDEKQLVAAAKLSAREVYSRAKAEAAAVRLRELYRAKGYADATIAVETASIRDGSIEVVFAINEAAAVKVVQVAFTGNSAFSDAQLRDVVTTRAAGLFDFLRAPTAPLPERLGWDREALLRHYKRNGFADVSVGEARAEREQASEGNPGGWRITFPIEEGEKYTISVVRLRSAVAGIPSQAFGSRTGLEAGQVYDIEHVEKAIERLTAALIDAGHAAVEVRAFPRRDPAARTIGLDLEIQQGQHLVIERIDIAGNKWTRDHVIRRELNFAEGDIFHPLIAEIARKRLMKLGLFKTVEVKRGEPGGQARDRVPVIVTVVEADSREIGFGIGYSERDGVTGDITLAERNFMGRGQEVRLKLAASERSTEARLSFTEPRLWGTPIASGFDVFYRDNDLSSTSSYKSTRYGGTLRAGTQVAPDTTSTVSYSLSRSTIYDVGAGASQAVKLAVPGYPNANSASYLTSAVGHSLTYDTRDSRTNPMKGVLVTSTQEVAGLGGDVRYLRNTAEVRGYVPVTDQINLVGKASAGNIVGWGGSEVRLLDTFYRGSDIVRGFAPSGIGPRDVLSTAKDALGGTTYAATTAELRISLPGITESSGLRAAVFADAGTLFGTSNTAKALPGVVGTSAALRASVGAGLVWDSPVGALQAGYAVPIARQSFDKTQGLYFGLGSGL